MTSRLLLHEGSVPFRGQRTWFGVAGDHEEPEAFRAAVLGFLERVESGFS